MLSVNEPLLNGREKELLIQCVETGWISSDGPFVKQFEADFSRYLGATHGVAVCNGTAALETALYAAGVKPGDEVIMPSFTIISCALAAIRVGAKPIFVDVESDTWNIDVSQIESRITPNTRVIMAVHMYGHPVDMDPVLAIARRHGLIVLEDAAQVHGAEYKGKKCGSIGHLSSFSFYANKILTTGEGGMVVTSDEAMAERASSYRNLCFQSDRRFYHTELGYNFRMTNLQAAIGVAQLERLDEFVAKKRHFGEYYRHRLGEIRGIKTQVEKEWAKTVYWMYCIELDETTGLTAKDMMMALAERQIMTRPFFLGMHEQPILRKLGLVREDEHYPVTERIARQGLYLPSGMTLEESDVDYVTEAVSEIMHKAQ